MGVMVLMVLMIQSDGVVMIVLALVLMLVRDGTVDGN